MKFRLKKLKANMSEKLDKDTMVWLFLYGFWGAVMIGLAWYFSK